ncbi:MAG: hypothetical protein IH936_09945 [Acidobacteria bacterium]|nr:hypothetical protein [Acidobacteriota bacterium]
MKMDTPNACNMCHTDRAAEWAAEQVRAWYGAAGNGYQGFAEILYAARNGTPVAERLLVQLAQDESAPAIARATALSQLQRYVSPVSFNVVRSSLKNADPLIRAAAVGVFEGVAPEERLSHGTGQSPREIRTRNDSTTARIASKETK